MGIPGGTGCHPAGAGLCLEPSQRCSVNHGSPSHQPLGWGGGGARSGWSRQRSVVKAWAGDFSWAPAGWRCGSLCLAFEACLSWPSCVSPCYSHTSLFPLPWTDLLGCFLIPGLRSLNLCLQKCLSWDPAAWWTLMQPELPLLGAPQSSPH